MNKKNYLRKNCKDVFKSFLVENATYNEDSCQNCTTVPVNGYRNS